MRFITWDEDRVVTGIIDQTRNAAERTGFDLEVSRCRYPSDVHRALSELNGPVVLMTHGFFATNDFTNNGEEGKYQVASLDELVPARIAASALFVLACYQDPTAWAARMQPGSLLVTTPQHLTSSAVRQLVPALVAGRPTVAAEVVELLRLVAHRRRDKAPTSELSDETVNTILAVTDSAVSTLATRTWQVQAI